MCIFYDPPSFLDGEPFTENLTVRTPTSRPCYIEHRMSVTERYIWTKTRCPHSCYALFVKITTLLTYTAIAVFRLPQSTEFLCYVIEFNQFYNLSLVVTCHVHTAHWQVVIGDVDIGPKISRFPTIGGLGIMWATYPAKREQVIWNWMSSCCLQCQVTSAPPCTCKVFGCHSSCIVVGSRRLMPPDALQPKACCTNPGL